MTDYSNIVGSSGAHYDKNDLPQHTMHDIGIIYYWKFVFSSYVDIQQTRISVPLYRPIDWVGVSRASEQV